MIQPTTPTPRERHQAMLANAAEARQARRDRHLATNRARLEAAAVPRMEKALQARLHELGMGIVLTTGMGDLWHPMCEFIATGMRGDEQVCVGCFTSDDRRTLELSHPEDITVFPAP